MHTFAQKPKATQQTTSPKSMKSRRTHFWQSREVKSTLHFQPTSGIQAGQRLLQANAEELDAASNTTVSAGFARDFSRIPLRPKADTEIQSNLMVSTPGDVYEQEADHVADRVMRMPEPQLKPACACGGGCPRCREEHSGREQLQTMPILGHNAGETNVPYIVQKVVSSPGQPLDSTTQAFMGPRFGYNFSRVRVHADAQAAASAEAINAKAYTVGKDVIFGAGRFSPGTRDGKRLLAHELTHVVQQNQMKPLQMAVPRSIKVQNLGTFQCSAPIIARQSLFDDRFPLRHLPLPPLPFPFSPLLPPVIPLPGRGPVSPSGCTLETMLKVTGYSIWRQRYIRTQPWREVLDAWFFETGPNPVTYSGRSDPRNVSIIANTGFQDLFHRWIAGERAELPDGSWLRDEGFQWRYELPPESSPGGGAAYDSATHFLGTYQAYIRRADTNTWRVAIRNKSHWESGTRLPDDVVTALRVIAPSMSFNSLWRDHERGQGPCPPSTGGDLHQVYRFDIRS